MMKFKKKFAALFAAATMAISTIAGSATAMAESVEYDDDAIVVWGLTSAWADLSPFSNTSGNSYSGIVISMIYDKLVYCTREDIYPRAAESWEMSEDNLTMTFYLNPDSKFHDGEPVTANDWVFAMNVLADPDCGFADHSQLNIFAGTDDSGDVVEGEELGIYALDDYTLEVNFKNPMKADTFLISYSWILTALPEHILGDVDTADIASNEFFQAPIGSGPCVFESTLTGSELTLTKFEDYPIGESHFSKMVLKVMSSDALATAMMSGEIDVAFAEISNEEALAMESLDTITVDKVTEPATTWYLSFNNQLITDVRVRQAVNYAVDKELIAEQFYQGMAEPMESFLPFSSDVMPDSITYNYDPEYAQQLLEEAMADGYDGQLTIAASAGTRERMAVLIEQELEAIGFDVTVETVEGTTMFADLRLGEEGTFDCGVIGFGISPDICYYNGQLDPTMATLSSVTDMTYKEYQDAYLAENDEEAAKEIFGEYLEYIHDECPVVFLVGTYDYATYTSRMGDITEDLKSISLRDIAVYNWKVTK